MSPVERPWVCAIPAESSEISGMLGRLAVAMGSHACVSHAAISPSLSTAARRSSIWAGPLGSSPCSSWRLHCTRTGRPTALEALLLSRAVGPVGARPVQVDDAHLRPVDPEHARERVLQPVHVPVSYTHLRAHETGRNLV